MMRFGPAAGALVLSLVGHMSLARWAEDHSDRLRKNRKKSRSIALFVACLGPLVRAVSIYTGHGQGLSPYALIEVTLVAFAGSTVGVMKTLFWLYGKVAYLVRRRALGLGSAAPRAPHGEAAPDAVAATPETTEAASHDTRPSEAPTSAHARFEHEEEARVSRRLVLERAVGLSLVAGSTGAIGWGIVRGRHDFRVEEVVVKIPGLSPKLDGYTIAQVSDIHTGTFVTPRELAEGFAKVREIRPDLVVATGDLVDHDPAYCELLARELTKLPSRDGVYAIYGNHDYTTGHAAVAEALARAGVRLLVNDGLAIRAAEGGFALLGLDEIWGRYWGKPGPDLARAAERVRETDLPRIVLSHQPKTFRDMAGKCALQLSGHTHGGQINPGFRPADLVFEFVAGRYERAGSTLWVNRGFGTAGPPSRVGAPPEVTKIVLVAG
ncbi:MAG: metallophosphoesterase [Polyangiaceae bacterium]